VFFGGGYGWVGGVDSWGGGRYGWGEGGGGCGGLGNLRLGAAAEGQQEQGQEKDFLTVHVQ
jgi:hypothetical protein